jgi:hypothetical protein
MIEQLVGLHHLSALPFLLVFLWGWKSYPLFFTLLHKDGGKLVLSSVSSKDSRKYTPLLVKADSYAYSDDAGGLATTSFHLKDSRPDLKPSTHLVDEDLVNLEIWFWDRVNLFLSFSIRLCMSKDWDRFDIYLDEWAQKGVLRLNS